MSLRRALSSIVLLVLGGFIVFCAVWRVDGGRWEDVRSPSMGTRAPVGSLLWVRPVDFDDLRVGDFITFRQPGSGGVTYSHQVHTRNADGSVTTKGVIPAPDPWHLRSADVVGRVVMTWPGGGWLVRAAPVLLIGGLLVAALRALLPFRWKLPFVIVSGAVVAAVAIVWLRPFTNAEQLASRPAPGGGADVSYVGTGLLPIRLRAQDSARESAVMGPGEVGEVRVTHVGADGRLKVGLSPAIPWEFWVVLVGACFLPAVAESAAGVVRRRRRPA